MLPISIIVPIFNAEKYLKPTIASILNQTFEDFELIIVNDGSTDKSAEIVEEFAKLDSRILVISQENKGVSAARNMGLSQAKGEYVCFIDGDDLVDKNMLRNLYNNAKDYNADISCCGITQKSLNGIENANYCTGEKELITDIEKILKNFFDNPVYREVLYGPYNKIIRRDIAVSVSFEPRFAIAEDLLFNFECLEKTSSFYFENVGYYHYIKRENSATTSKFSTKRFDYIKVADILLDKCYKSHPSVYPSALIWAFNHKLNMCRALIVNSGIKKENQEFYNDCFAFCKNNWVNVSKKLSAKMRAQYFILRFFPALFKIINKLK